MHDRPAAPPEILEPGHFEAHGYPHATWSRLRREAPVAWCQPANFPPFWAVTRHSDVIEASRQPAIFQSTARFALAPDDVPDLTQLPLRHLLNMNPPEHRDYRKLVSRFFTRRAIETRRAAVASVVEELVEGLEGDVEFVDAIAARVPIAVIAEMLGLPPGDWQQLYRWTNEIVGCTDPEYQEPDRENTLVRALREQFEYFRELVAERRRRPTEDLVTVLAHARVHGELLSELDLLSYLFLLVTAGNETTRNALSGGVLAFAEHPGQLEKLRANPDLVPSAGEEVLRWTSPIIHICREASRDTTLGGQTIRSGENVALFFPSANRDEEVFDEPFRFRIDRARNHHLAFGTGEHACLGSHLARLEIQAVLAGLARRVERVELAGPPVRLRGSFVGGIKSLPVHVTLR
jgi:cholest-4-en-3-one 26-monooxygenase